MADSITLDHPLSPCDISTSCIAYGVYTPINKFKDLLDLLKADKSVRKAFEDALEKVGLLDDWQKHVKNPGAIIPSIFRNYLPAPVIVCTLTRNGTTYTANGILYCTTPYLWRAQFQPPPSPPLPVGSGYELKVKLNNVVKYTEPNLTVLATQGDATQNQCGTVGIPATVADDADATSDTGRKTVPENLTLSGFYHRNANVKSLVCVVTTNVDPFPRVWGIFPGTVVHGVYEVLVPMPTDATVAKRYRGDVYLLDESGKTIHKFVHRVAGG